MTDEIDRIIAETIKAIDWSDARYADEPFYPKCAQAVRVALVAAGYRIELDPLLAKGRESGVKLVDPDFGAPTGFRSE